MADRRHGIQTFALIIGIAFLAAGVLGFVPALLTPPPPGHELAVQGFHGYLLGLFPVNWLHNVVHLAIGAWGIAGSRSYGGSVSYSRGIAVIYGILAVMGLFPVLNTTFGLIPIHGNDIWLHAGTAAIAAYFGWVVAGRGRRVTA